MNSFKLAEVLLKDYILPLKNNVIPTTNNQDTKIAAEDLLYKLDHIYQSLVKLSINDIQDIRDEKDIKERLGKAFENIKYNLTKNKTPVKLAKDSYFFRGQVKLGDILAKYDTDTQIKYLLSESTVKLTVGVRP